MFLQLAGSSTGPLEYGSCMPKFSNFLTQAAKNPNASGKTKINHDCMSLKKR